MSRFTITLDPIIIKFGHFALRWCDLFMPMAREAECKV
jgi:hypothetical protein